MGAVFAYFDGDNVGDRLELLLLDGEAQKAKVYSEAVSLALHEAVAILHRLGRVEVLVAGGDDLLVSWQSGAVTMEDLEFVRETFTKICGQSMSVGVGVTTYSAVHCLRRAKLLGRAQVVSEVGVFDVD